MCSTYRPGSPCQGPLAGPVGFPAAGRQVGETVTHSDHSQQDQESRQQTQTEQVQSPVTVIQTGRIHALVTEHHSVNPDAAYGRKEEMKHTVNDYAIYIIVHLQSNIRPPHRSAICPNLVVELGQDWLSHIHRW